MHSGQYRKAKQGSWYGLGKPADIEGQRVKKIAAPLENKRPTLETVGQIAKASDVSRGWLAYGDGLPEGVTIRRLRPGGVTKEAWAIFGRSDCLAFAGPHARLAAFPVTEDRHPKYGPGDCLIVDLNRDSFRESGDYCLEIAGELIVREIGLRTAGFVCLVEPPIANEPPEIIKYPVHSFPVDIKIWGKVVEVRKHASSCAPVRG